MKEKMKKIYESIFKEEKEEKNKWFIIITTVIYSIIMIIVCCMHEAWEDESQAWLIARDLSLIDIYDQMKYEGHSCLWHYLLVPFAKLGLPFDAIKILGIVPAIITTILILKKAPFSRFTKVLIIFSSTFLYYMPAIVRPYSLLPLLVVWLCIIYKDRREKPILYGVILAIISNLHITLIGFTGMLILTFYIEELVLNYKKLSKEQIENYIMGGSIAMIGILFIIIQAIRGAIYSTVKVPTKIDWNVIISNFLNGLYKVVEFTFGIEWVKYGIIIAAIALAIVIIQSILNSRKQGLILLVSMLWFWFVQTAIYAMQINQRAAMLFVLLVFYAWCYRYDKKYSEDKVTPNLVTSLICLICILSLNNTIRLVRDEIQKPYMDSRQIAKYIEENIEEGTVILTNNFECTSPVIAYLNGKDYKFYDIRYNRYLTYVVWAPNKKEEINLEEMFKKLELENKPKYILYSQYAGQEISIWNIYNIEKYEYNCIYKCEEGIFREYTLFELTEREKK